MLSVVCVCATCRAIWKERERERDVATTTIAFGSGDSSHGARELSGYIFSYRKEKNLSIIGRMHH